MTKHTAKGTETNAELPQDDTPVLVTLRLVTAVGDFAAGRVVKAPEKIASTLLKSKPPKAEKANRQAIALGGPPPLLTML